jgi:hypothetical protein
MGTLILIVIAVLGIGVGAILVYRNNQVKIEEDVTDVTDTAKKL